MGVKKGSGTHLETIMDIDGWAHAVTKKKKTRFWEEIDRPVVSGRLNHSVLDERVIKAVLEGCREEYIKDGKLLFDSIVLTQDKITFLNKDVRVAAMNVTVPSYAVNFRGNSITFKLPSGHMGITIE